MLKLFNTFTGEKEEFKPIKKGHVSFYTCGPTVYDYAHIGNLRAYLFEDLLRRTLKLVGYQVKQVMNITDVDDKTIQRAVERGVSLADFTREYIDAFFSDLDRLGIERAEVYPRATEHIPQMTQMIETLIEKGYAYKQENSVYYRVSEFKDYGKLSKKDLEENIAGARVDHDEYNKESLTDFALWKAKKEDEPSWDSPFGQGRPGWHIECSAMSMKYLGQTFDIHTGGEDNIFPHHENEIAQSEASTGKRFVNYWLHCKFLLVDGHKMSKSLNNFYTLKDLKAKGYDPLAVRYLLMAHHYRHPVNFTFKGLEDAEQVLRKIKDFWIRFKEFEPAQKKMKNSHADLIKKAEQDFVSFLEDDLNISGALGVFFDLLREVNKAMDDEDLSADEKLLVKQFLDKTNRILGLEKEAEADEIPKEILDLAKAREDARASKDFKKADEMRDLISKKGYVLEDLQGQTRVKKK